MRNNEDFNVTSAAGRSNVSRHRTPLTAILLFALAMAACYTPAASAQNAANADTSYNSYLSAFLVRSGGQTYIANGLTNRKIADLWGEAYMITGVEDAYDRAPTPANKQLISDLLNTFITVYSTDWSGDGWNDDVAWSCLAMIRGYQITGNTTFLNAATSNWNMVYNRGWDSALGGGIWETQDKYTKAALSNDPMVIAGCYIYQSTNDAGYLTKCQNIYAWVKNNLVGAEGQVNEAVTSAGALQSSDNAYNDGAFINAADSLYKITRNSGYFNDAKLAADHIVNTNDVLYSPGGSSYADQFVRGLSRFARDNNLWGTYSGWLNNNAATSWNNRRTDLNLTNNNWKSPTPGGDAYGMDSLSAMVVQQVSQINPLVGTHMIVNQLTNQAVDNGGSLANNAGIIQWGKGGQPWQRWNFTQNSDSSWNIVNTYSTQGLDTAGLTTNGKQLIQWPADSGNTNQRWWVDQQPNGSYKIWSKASGLALDGSSSLTNGYPLIQWTWNGQAQQLWLLQ